jgi:hypothetical protein
MQTASEFEKAYAGITTTTATKVARLDAARVRLSRAVAARTQAGSEYSKARTEWFAAMDALIEIGTEGKVLP